MLEYVDELEKAGATPVEIDLRIGEYYTNRLVKKYSNEQQDSMWDEIYKTIMEVDGGYWQIVDNMDYMPEFEHRRFKCLKSEFGQK
jgi:hypothetical protein